MIKLFKDILVFILSFFEFVIISLFFLVCSFSSYLTPKSITDTFKKIDFKEIIKDENGNNTELSLAIKETLELSGVPDKAVDEILESEATKEFLGSFVGNSLNSVIHDDKEKPVKSKDIVNLVEKNMDIVSKKCDEANIPFTDTMKQNILNNVEKNAEIIIKELPNASEIVEMTGNDKLKDIQKFSQLLLGNNTKKVLLISFLVCAFLILLLRLKQFIWLKSISLPITLSSIILIISSTVFKSQISSIILNSVGNMKTLFNPIMDGIMNKIMTFGILGFAVSIFLIVIYILIGKKS